MRLKQAAGVLLLGLGVALSVNAAPPSNKPHKGKGVNRRMHGPMGKHAAPVEEALPLSPVVVNPSVPAPAPLPPPAAPSSLDTHATPPPSLPPPAAAPPVPAEPTHGISVNTTDVTATSSSSSSTSSSTQPLSIPASDGTVGGSTRALADAVREAYSKLGMASAFHRVAVPYFTEIGQDVSDHHLGRVVTELMAVELGKQPPFTVVEREHLDTVMKEYRLADLGVVDKNSAAQFGKMLGAQSIVSGSVSDAGPSYIVTVRLVDVESARVLVSGSTDVQKAGLIALSADAVEMRSKSAALFHSALIPGWGQFYNREPVKGYTFVGLGAASLGTAAGFYIAANSALSVYKQDNAHGVPYRNTANDRISIANYALMTYGVVWVVGMIDAYVNGTDATSVNLQNSDN